MLRPIRPDKLARMARVLAQHGVSPAAGAIAAAIDHPHDTALIDERGTLSFEQLDRRSNALAHSLAGLGVRSGDGIGIMCRNHRGFVDATIAAAKLGASALYLNTMFSGPQLADVIAREGPRMLIHDEEFSGLLEGVEGVERVIAWTEGEAGETGTTLEALIASGDESSTDPPKRGGPLRHPHLGDDRDAEGSAADQPRRPRRARRALRPHPLSQRRADDDRLAPVSLLGLHPLRPRPAARLDDDPAPALRPRGNAAGGPGSPRPGAGGGPGDDPADPRAAGGDAGQVRPLLAEDHLGLGLCPAGRDGAEVDGPLRRQHLQPLRLDRGRLRDDRHPGGAARRAGDRRPARRAGPR